MAFKNSFEHNLTTNTRIHSWFFVNVTPSPIIVYDPQTHECIYLVSNNIEKLLSYMIHKVWLMNGFYLWNSLQCVDCKLCWTWACWRSIEMVHIYVSWNALIGGYVEHEPFSEILKCIQQIKLEEIVPNVVTYSWCLKACGRVGDVEKVRRFYAKIVWDGPESDICIENSVIGMYARCWSLLDA